MHALAARATKATATALSGQTLDVISQDDATIWLARFPALGDVQGNVALRAIYPTRRPCAIRTRRQLMMPQQTTTPWPGRLPVTYDIDVWATRSRNAGLGDAKTVVLQRNSETAYMNSAGGAVLATSTKIASWYQRSRERAVAVARPRLPRAAHVLRPCERYPKVRGRRRRDAANDRKGRRLGLKYHDLKPLTTPARAAARILLLVWWGLLFTAWAPYIRRGGALYLPSFYWLVSCSSRTPSIVWSRRCRVLRRSRPLVAFCSALVDDWARRRCWQLCCWPRTPTAARRVR